jgi:sigma-B regulation protein RsbU (phosphoserine phosphatase)
MNTAGGIIGNANDYFMLDASGRFLFDSSGLGASIDASGKIQAPDYSAASNAELSALARKMINQESGYTQINYNNKNVYIAYHPVRKLGWSFAVVFYDRAMLGAMNNLEQQILHAAYDTEERTKRDIITALVLMSIAGAAFFAAAVFGAAVFAKRFAAQIEGFSGRLERIDGKTIGETIPLNADTKEAYQCIRAFNAMTARVCGYIHDIENASSEKKRLTADLSLAAHMQARMVPHNFPPFEGHAYLFDIYGEMHPAKEVGGDFYDYFYIDDDHFAFVIADVSGKGIPSALFMIVTKTLIKNMLQSGYSIDRAMEKVNQQTCGSGEDGMFVTVWSGVLELSSGKLEFVNAGHNPPLLSVEENPYAAVVSKPDLVIGADFSTKYTRREIYIKPGDVLFLYTDGIIETFNEKKKMFGFERLKSVIDEMPRGSSFPLLFGQIKNVLSQWTGGAEQFDDITMLALRLRPASI